MIKEVIKQRKIKPVQMDIVGERGMSVYHNIVDWLGGLRAHPRLEPHCLCHLPGALCPWQRLRLRTAPRSSSCTARATSRSRAGSAASKAAARTFCSEERALPQRIMGLCLTNYLAECGALPGKADTLYPSWSAVISYTKA